MHQRGGDTIPGECNAARDGAAWGSQFGLLTSSMTSTFELPDSPGGNSMPH